MPVPTVTLNVLDGGLQQNLQQPGNILYVIGPASQGPYWQVLTSTNPQDFVTQNGYGSGVECAAFTANSSGTPVAYVAVPVTGGANTSVFSSTVNGSTSAVTLSGTPFDNYYGLVTVLTGGTIGQTGIQLGISLDAGRTTYQTANLLAATTYAIPNTNLTLAFGTGGLVAGDSYKWISTEGVWTDASIQSAVNAMIPLPSLTPLDLIIVGGSATRTGGASTAGAGTVGVTSGDVTAFDGYMTTLFNKRRFSRLLCHAGDAAWGGSSTETEATWSTSLQTAFAASSSLRVGVTAGHYNAISPLSQVQFRRPLLWQAAARDAAVAIQVDLGRVKDGSLANMPLPTKADGYLYHDEAVNPGLDAARFMTAFSIAGKPGLFITNPNLMAPPGSDFNWLQHGHVMDATCQISLNYLVNLLSDSVRVNASTGTILAQDAQNIQQQLYALLFSGLVTTNAASAVGVVVNQQNNILTSAQLIVTVSVTPLGYIKSVNTTLTFVNPAIQAVQPTLGGP
jgi:hypothetical protein